MKKVIYLFSITIILLSTSCKKNDDPPANLKTYISKQNFANVGTYIWSYDAQKRLTSIIFTSANEAANPSYTYSVNAFDGSNRIADVLVDYNSASETDYRIQNTFDATGKLILANYTNAATGAVINSSTAVFSGNNVTITTKSASGSIVYIDVYTLSSDGKNIEKRERKNSAGVLQSTDVYTGYNTNKNYAPLYPMGYAIGPQSENLYAQDAYTNNLTGATTNYNYTYEYNSDGYITKRISSTSGSFNTYEYIKN